MEDMFKILHHSRIYSSQTVLFGLGPTISTFMTMKKLVEVEVEVEDILLTQGKWLPAGKKIQNGSTLENNRP